MSRGAERLIRRMVQANADLRCMAADAMADAYWPTHDRATVSSSHSTRPLHFTLAITD
jgi:hypothetical protein